MNTQPCILASGQIKLDESGNASAYFPAITSTAENVLAFCSATATENVGKVTITNTQPTKIDLSGDPFMEANWMLIRLSA